MPTFLTWLAAQIDRLVPGKGHRTLLTGILLILSSLLLFLLGKENAQEATIGMMTGLGLIFSSVHTPKTPE